MSLSLELKDQKMPEEFYTVSPLSFRECKQLINYKVVDKSVQFYGTNIFPYKRVRFTSESDFYVVIRKMRGRIVGTIKPHEKDKTEIRFQLRRIDCYMFNLPAAVFMLTFVLAVLHTDPILTVLSCTIISSIFIAIILYLVCTMSKVIDQIIIDNFIKIVETSNLKDDQKAAVNLEHRQ